MSEGPKIALKFLKVIVILSLSQIETITLYYNVKTSLYESIQFKNFLVMSSLYKK